MLLPRRLLRDRVSISTFKGHGAYGDVWNEPVEVLANVASRTNLVASGGDEDVIAVVSVYLRPQSQRPGSGEFFDATAVTVEAKLTVAGQERRVRGVQHHSIRGRLVAVELQTA